MLMSPLNPISKSFAQLRGPPKKRMVAMLAGLEGYLLGAPQMGQSGSGPVFRMGGRVMGRDGWGVGVGRGCGVGVGRGCGVDACL